MPKNFSIKFFSIAGFTLVEVLVVVAIIAIVTVISIPSFATFSRKQLLQSEAEKMVTRIELAQSKAKSGDQGESETEEVQGYFIDFESTDPPTNNYKYYFKKHRNDSTGPFTYVVTEDEYTLDQNITGITFEDGGGEVLTRDFYYQSPRGYLSCLTTAPTDGNDQAECAVPQFKITLSNSYREAIYVYIERGGAVYESDS